MKVVLFDQPSELREFAKGDIAGFVAARAGSSERVAVLAAEREISLNPVLKHELAHAVAGQMLRRQPSWFAEGLACFLQNTRRDPEQPRDIVGELDEPRVQWLAQHGAMSAAETLATAGAAELPDREGARFESTAYEIFFVLFNQRAAGLAAYLRLLAQGREPKSAFQISFPDLTPEKLDAMVIASQTAGAHYAKLGVPLEEYRGALAVRALTPAEIHAQLAALFAAGPADDRGAARARAEDEALLALQLDADNAEALETLARLGSQKAGDLRERARAAARAHPDSWRAQLLLAELLEATDGSAQGAQVEEQLAAAQAALRLGPEFAEALAIEATALLAQQRPAEALPAALRAAAIDPEPRTLEVLAGTQLALHRLPEANAAVSRALELAGERASRELVAGLRRLQARIAEDKQSDWGEIERAAGAGAPK